MRRILLLATFATLTACSREPEPVANRFEATSAEIPRAAAQTCTSVPVSTPSADAIPARRPCAALRVTM